VVWRVLLTLALWLAVVFLLRFIPIILYTAVHGGGEIPREETVAVAKEIVFEHPIWSTAIGILNAALSLPLIWFMMRVIEKRSFELKEVGLDWRHNSLAMLGSGALLALSMYIAQRIAALALGYSMPAVGTILAGVTATTVVRNLALWIPMGFAEEVVFRGYIQTRFVERYGAIRGILMAGIVFTLPHLIVHSLSPVSVFSGVILWAAIGTLYHCTKSLYLVGMFHGVANLLLNTFSFEEGHDAAGLAVHILTLGLIVVICNRRLRSHSAPRNSA
jgi:membrane protease YdiL (CAAX protease family)